MKRTEFSTCDEFLDEWPEGDTFEQVIFKVTNWDDAVVVKDDFEELRRPELVARMYDYRAGLDAATGDV